MIKKGLFFCTCSFYATLMFIFAEVLLWNFDYTVAPGLYYLVASVLFEKNGWAIVLLFGAVLFFVNFSENKKKMKVQFFLWVIIPLGYVFMVVLSNERYPLHNAIMKGNILTNEVLDHYAKDINKATGRNQYSPLILAVNKESIENVSLLLNYGANPNAQSKNKRTALIYAVGTENIEIILSLLKHKADVNMCAKDMNCPLLFAVATKNLEIVRVLIEFGAEMKVQNKAGDLPISLARKMKLEKIVKYFQSLQ